jgi:hypothetical protein
MAVLTTCERSPGVACLHHGAGAVDVTDVSSSLLERGVEDLLVSGRDAGRS